MFNSTHPWRYHITVIIGFLVAVLPFLGFPGSWRQTMFAVLGVFLIGIGLTGSHRMRLEKNTKRSPVETKRSPEPAEEKEEARTESDRSPQAREVNPEGSDESKAKNADPDGRTDPGAATDTKAKANQKAKTRKADTQAGEAGLTAELDAEDTEKEEHNL